MNGNQTIDSFARAKKHVYRLAGEQPRTFYCNCAFADRKVLHESCGYVPLKSNKRARRTEVEHVVPAHSFGHGFTAWREGHGDCLNKNGRRFKGRNCARKVSMEYRRMEADLYNLQPAVGEVNGHRKHFKMGMLEGEKRAFGACDVEIANQRIEPRPQIRGDIARIYFYMDWAYPGRGIVSRKNRKLFEAWDRGDPVDAAERKRASLIEAIQGNRNPFIADAP